MLQLLPPVCRDCGKVATEAKLSAYLDFHLCKACIAVREREVMKIDGPRRRPPSRRSRREARGDGKPKATRPAKVGAKPPARKVRTRGGRAAPARPRSRGKGSRRGGR